MLLNVKTHVPYGNRLFPRRELSLKRHLFVGIDVKVVAACIPRTNINRKTTRITEETESPARHEISSSLFGFLGGLLGAVAVVSVCEHKSRLNQAKTGSATNDEKESLTTTRPPPIPTAVVISPRRMSSYSSSSSSWTLNIDKLKLTASKLNQMLSS